MVRIVLADIAEDRYNANETKQGIMSILEQQA